MVRPAARGSDPDGGLIRVLGVDPGSDATGYGVIDAQGSNCALVEYAAIRPPSRLAFAERLLAISNQFEEVIQRLHPDVCAVEETFHAVNFKSALKLGQARGVVLVAAARYGLPVFDYSPLAIKSALVGYGRAEKHQVQEMVRLILHLKEPPHPLDASDALAAAICHIHTSFTTTRQASRSRRGEPVNGVSMSPETDN